jgi:ATP-binding cassette subfamily C (CFTR/MRP) protein 1
VSSGKSSLILTLLRLLALQDGSITLDGVDIKQVRLDILRQQGFITVSQDHLLLANETLRFNLDPDSSVTNGDLVTALNKTQLWSHFVQNGASVPPNGFTLLNLNRILDKKLSLFAELSVGQEQLFALSRALVKAQIAQDSGRKPVILLDEVTSSLDPTTESIIHGNIDEEFTKMGHTVICVTHRIEVLAKHTVPGRDVVVLLGDGRLQEVITDLSPMTLEKLGSLD